MRLPNVFSDCKPDAKPCPVCLRLAKDGQIQPRAVMPLPSFPARLKSSNQQCCRDCQATETIMMMGAHPQFEAARLCVSNERCETLTMPPGMAERMGLCSEWLMRPASLDDRNRNAQRAAGRSIRSRTRKRGAKAVRKGN